MRRPIRVGATLLAVLLTTVVLVAMGAALAQRALAHVESLRTTARSDAARAAADAALVAAWRGWDGVRHASDSVGQVMTSVASADSAMVEVATIHGDARLWWMVATAWTSGGAVNRLVSRSSAMALWLRAGAPEPLAAVTGAGVLVASPTAQVQAMGSPPPGWACSPTTGFDAVVLSAPALMHAAAGVVSGSVRYSPPPGPDIGALWIADAATIAAAADVQLPVDTVLQVSPGTDSTDCGRAGWGEPVRNAPGAPCMGRFAVVHAGAALTLRGRGQGVIVADGPLVLDDSALFAGLVVARSTVRLHPGSRLTGALVMAGSTLSLDDGAVVEGARCVFRAALRGGTLLTEVPGQAWYRLR